MFHFFYKQSVDTLWTVKISNFNCVISLFFLTDITIFERFVTNQHCVNKKVLSDRCSTYLSNWMNEWKSCLWSVICSFTSPYMTQKITNVIPVKCSPISHLKLNANENRDVSEKKIEKRYFKLMVKFKIIWLKLIHQTFINFFLSLPSLPFFKMISPYKFISPIFIKFFPSLHSLNKLIFQILRLPFPLQKREIQTMEAYLEACQKSMMEQFSANS